MIGVGINENVILHSATIDEKQRLVIELGPAKAAEAKKSLFDESLTAGIQKEGKDTLALTMWPPMVSKKADQTNEKKALMMHDDLKRLNNQLVQILQQFMINDDIDLHKVKYEGTSVNADNYNDLMLDQDTVSKIYDNCVKRFVELIKPFTGDPQYAVRFKLIRQSKEKHYATIPSRFVDDNPFIELMAVPKEQSRVKFSAWELSQGLDSREVISKADTEAKGEDTGGNATAAPIAANPFAE
jgi:Cu/Ag efflux protein CusF